MYILIFPMGTPKLLSSQCNCNGSWPFSYIHAQDGALFQPPDRRHTVKQRGLTKILPLNPCNMQNLQAKSLKKISRFPPKERKKMEELCKVTRILLFILWQVKLIEDGWFSFLKFIKLIHSAGLASWFSKKKEKPHPPKVDTVKISSFKTTTPFQSRNC